MMEKRKLRQADFVMSLFLLFTGLYIIIKAMGMPMSGMYGGVENTWYVSPALFPLIVGGFLLILSVVLLIHSIKVGGLTDLIHNLQNIQWKIGDRFQRVLFVLYYFATFIYLFIPRVDFFLNVMVFLLIFVATFYFDKKELMHRFFYYYLTTSFLFLLLAVTGLDNQLKEMFRYTVDILQLVNIAALLVIVKISLGRYEDEAVEFKKKFRLMWLVSLIVPLFLCPTFRFALRIPLPYEGGIINIMHLIRNLLR